MQCDQWSTQDELVPDSQFLTIATVELAPVRSPGRRRKHVWLGMDTVPYFPNLQRYLARLSLSELSEIVWLHVACGALPRPIEMHFPNDRPTLH